MAVHCPQVVDFCRYRITALDSLGNVQSGANNSYVSDAGISLQITPQIITGEKKELRGGCGGCIIASKQDPNRLDRWQLDLVSGVFEPAALQLLLGVDAVTDGGDTVGIKGVDQSGCDFETPLVAFEAWAKAWEGTAQDGTRPWVYFVWTASFWQFAQIQLGADFLQPGLQAFTQANPLWVTGPYDDIGVVLDVPDWAIVNVDADPPDAACAYATVTPGS